MSRNKAKVQKLIDHMECEKCMTDYMFLMKDNYHAFFIPVDELFVAMQLASSEGIIPSLPKDWCYEMGLTGYTIIDKGC